MYWYNSWVSVWIILTIYLYYNGKFRDLGPSHQVFDYHDEIQMGFYRTMGLRLVITWTVWTYIAEIVFRKSIFFFLNHFFFLEYIRNYWYSVTLYSCIKMHLINIITSIYDTNMFIWPNHSNLSYIQKQYNYFEDSKFFFSISGQIITPENKFIHLWFPWSSFFNYLTIFGLLYILTLVSIYNANNPHHVVLYTIFLLFLFASNLVILDLDIFAGFLLLVESVVVLMLFFLIIYINPNEPSNFKINKIKLFCLLIIVLFILSTYSYPNLGVYFFNSLNTPIYFYDDYYEALNELAVNDLIGIFVGLYITDSLLLVIIGILLLISSIICVVIVSFFTKFRNSSIKDFLGLFSVVKTCYTFIFIRKQNLSKQGRSNHSTRVFNKKTFDEFSHKEYRDKYEMFEQQKKEQ